MRKKILTIIILLWYGCDKDSTSYFESTSYYKTYVANQSQDHIAILNSDTGELLKNIEVGLQINCSSFSNENECNSINGCVWHAMGEMSHCMESNDEDECMEIEDIDSCNNSINCEWMMNMCMESDGSMNMGHTPHFISIDEDNGFWFVTLMGSGYLEQYDLSNDNLISRIYLGDLPALSALDNQNKKIYISRMNMPGMPMMNASTNIINVISYSQNGLVLEEEINICDECDGIGPHALSIDNVNNQLYTASVLSDFIFKIDLNNIEILGSAMYVDNEAVPNTIMQKYKPIQCVYKNNYVFVSCSAGTWSLGDEEIPGQIHMYNSETLEQIDIFSEFSSNSSPWHIIADNNNKIYVTLSGEPFIGGQGVACLSFIDSELLLVWHNQDINSNMNSPHGLSLSYDGMRLFVSDRGNGKLYILNSESGEYVTEVNLSIDSIGSNATLGGVASTLNSW